MIANIREVENGYDVTEPPHSIEGEHAVLGSCLIERDAIIHVATVLKPRDFYNRQNALIYRAMLRLYRNRTPTDFTTVMDQLQRDGDLVNVGGVERLTELMSAVPTAVHANHYAGIVARYAKQRRMIDAGNEIAALAINQGEDPQDLADKATEILRKAIGHGQDLGWVDMTYATDYFVNALAREHERVIPTGFYDLDDRVMHGGLRNGEMTVIAARTGIGKSALALQLINEFGDTQGLRVGLVSLEMSLVQIVSRLAAINSNLDMSTIRWLARRQKLQDHHWEQIMTAMGKLSNAQLRILLNRNLSTANLASRITQLHAVQGLDCLVVDYLQLMRGDGGKDTQRYIEVGKISGMLKGIALDLDIPVIALSQINRSIENRGDDARPRLSDLRESGNIEQDADNVIFIHRAGDAPSDTTSEAELIVAKQREGITDTVNLVWHPMTTKFLNAARSQDQ